MNVWMIEKNLKQIDSLKKKIFKSLKYGRYY